MARQPEVSVVIPAYNHERFVAEAIHSAQIQHGVVLEIVVVDDGSRDATATVVGSLAAEDPRIRLLRQSNGGSHSALNRGIRASRGDWIAILNSDDRYHPDRLGTMLDACDGRYDFAVTDARLIDGEGKAIDDPAHWWLRANAAAREHARAHGVVHGLMFGNYTVSTSNFLFRRTVFEAIGPFRPLRHILDWDFALRAALHDRDRFLYLQDQVLLDYRIHGGNAILNNTARGALEVSRLQRGLLTRIGVPASLVSSIYRTQRDLRRHGRVAGYAVPAARLADRERDIAYLQAEVAKLTQALGNAERIAHEREADRAQLAVEARDVRAENERLLVQLQLAGEALQSMLDKRLSARVGRMFQALGSLKNRN